MTERAYRFVLGTALVLLLYFHLEPLQYVYVSILLWEGLTGYRIPVIVSQLRYGTNYQDPQRDPSEYRFRFEAERGMRLAFAAVLVPTFFLLPADYWFVGWLAAIALYVAGLVNYCPMVMILRWLGFR
jgi:hypothetical protein